MRAVVNTLLFDPSAMSDPQFEKFTKEAKQALIVAQEKSREAGLNYVGTEHVLIGVLSQSHSLGASILMSFGVSLDNVYLVLKTAGRATSGKPQAKPGGFSGFAKQVIEDAVRCAHDFNYTFVGTEHLLFALCAQENTAATVILENMKISPQQVRDQITQVFKKNRAQGGASGTQQAMQNGMNPLEFFLNGLNGVLVGYDKEGGKEAPTQPYKNQNSTKSGSGKNADGGKSKTPALDYFTLDLTVEARKGKLDPVVGRAKEIERMVSILNRKTKNNPVLIGEPGVGKTAIVEGLAQAIVMEQVPESLLDKKILSLSMSSLIAGTKYRGEFEERLKQIIDEASIQPNIVLFVDELHTVVGAGSAEGSLDAANILKPALARGQVQIVGATTTTDYRKQVENDPALERRFQPIMVEEPTPEEALEILYGIRKSFEDHHNLIIDDSALESAVTFSKRYISDRFLPDKAIDLIDEAAALKRVKDSSRKEEVQKIQKKLNDIVKKKEQAVTDQDYERAAELRCKELEFGRQLEEVRKVVVPRDQREHVDNEDIARVISKMTGVPVTRLVKADLERLANLEQVFKSRIVGQDEAIAEVSKAIRRSRAGISDERRPIASFIFMGPTGVGKTELVKALAEEVYLDDKALIKIDMSEFMERHNTSRLTGTTAGYVGYEEGGSLTEAVRRRPYSVVLFDEIEKAHPDVFNMLLQVLEDGVLTDGKGRRVDFRNTIIVMTSNIGAARLSEKAGPIGFETISTDLEKAETAYDRMKGQVLDEMKDYFRPEFLNRLDKIVMFNPLTHATIKEIVSILVGQLQKRLDPRGVTLQLSESGLDFLAEKGFDPKYGARPARRAIRDFIEDPLTTMFLEGKVTEGDIIQLRHQKGKGLVLKKISGKKLGVAARGASSQLPPAEPERKLTTKSS
ncbi:ATP-dependent Clp protease ATP-binding subunit ClpC [Candidatus Peregrinibacteria bacterium CG_4_9_14_0_2_um_filter_53_11]|nr:MAG: ATP-dependent Clp protease ATP-binding subunit ClpC [Candidatus Peregrinibacteria bacterium CG_4_9_14_0_2_um_filter_53_11]